MVPVLFLVFRFSPTGVPNISSSSCFCSYSPFSFCPLSNFFFACSKVFLFVIFHLQFLCQKNPIAPHSQLTFCYTFPTTPFISFQAFAFSSNSFQLSSGGFNNKINKLHERLLRIVYKKPTLNFQELL